MNQQVVQSIASVLTTGIVALIGYGMRRVVKSVRSHQGEHDWLIKQVGQNTAAIKRILEHAGIANNSQ